MSSTMMVQAFKDEERECPKCFSKEYEADIEHYKNDLVSRRCITCNHEWLDTLTIKEWQKIKRREGAKRRGNLNQWAKKQPSRKETLEY